MSSTAIETLIFHTKLLTALVVILNVALFLSLRAQVAWAKKMAEQVGASSYELMKKKLVMGLICTVMVVNAVAVYGNHHMLKAVRDISDNEATLNTITLVRE
jgi:hypothetical protein